MNKNICLIVETLGAGGGIERVALSLAQSLSSLGCRVDIISLEDQISYPSNNFNFNIHTTKRIKHPIKSVQIARQAKFLQKKITDIGVYFDLIIANGTKDSRACRKLNLPNTYYCVHAPMSKVIDSHANNAKGFSKLRRKIEHSFLIKKLYKNQNLITVSNGVGKDLIELGVKPKTMQTIYNPFDFNSIKQQSNAYTVKEENYIIHAARFSVGKQHDILIKAYKQSGIKQKLLLLGDDSDNPVSRNVHQLIKDLDLQGKVIFKGFNSNPFPYIKNADALILSSRYEGFGMVLVEALILGTPIVSTDCPVGPGEILIDELKPFLSPIKDVQALADNIKKMVDNPVKITDKYINRFSAEKIAKQYLSLCK